MEMMMSQSDDRTLTSAQVTAILREFAATSKLPTGPETRYLLWEIFQTWRRYGYEEFKKTKGGRPGRSIRSYAVGANKILNIAARASGVGGFKTDELAQLFQIFFTTWYGGEGDPASHFSEMLGYESKLATILCPADSIVTLQRPRSLLLENPAVTDCSVADIIDIVRAFMANEPTTISVDHDFGTSHVQVTIKHIHIERSGVIVDITVPKGFGRCVFGQGSNSGLLLAGNKGKLANRQLFAFVE